MTCLLYTERIVLYCLLVTTPSVSVCKAYIFLVKISKYMVYCNLWTILSTTNVYQSRKKGFYGLFRFVASKDSSLSIFLWETNKSIICQISMSNIRGENYRPYIQKILLNIIHNVQVGEPDENVCWKLGQKGFTIKTLYNALQTRAPSKKIRHCGDWNYVLNSGKIVVSDVERTLTKDNMRRRGWDGDVHCVFCASDESMGSLVDWAAHSVMWAPMATLHSSSHGEFTSYVPPHLQQLGMWLSKLKTHNMGVVWNSVNLHKTIDCRAD